MRQTITKRMMTWLRSRINSAKKIKVFFQRFDFVFWGTVMLWIVLALMLIMFVSVMASECVYAIVSDLLGTGGKAAENKTKTLQFVGFGMGGVLAAIGAIAINRRADAQAENNKLIEKGHINERFKSATENLGHSSANVRTASYYQFYYLAKEGKEDFRHSIFEILCSCLRSMPLDKSHLTKADGKPTAEFQTLINILLHSNYHSVFDGFEPDLQKVFLLNTYLENANLLGANLSDADLSYARLYQANLFCANLSNANLSDTDLSDANLSGAQLLKTDISGAQLLKTDLSGAQLSFMDFSYSDLLRPNLSGTRISLTNLSSANLLDTNLSGARISATNLSSANLSGANLSGARISHTKLLGANLSGANLLDVILINTNLQGAQLKGANLMKVDDIEKADFRGAKIGDRPITKDDLPSDKGEYYADWNPPPEKEEN